MGWVCAEKCSRECSGRKQQLCTDALAQTGRAEAPGPRGLQAAVYRLLLERPSEEISSASMRISAV